MRWRRIEDGTTKTEVHFAWVPTLIEGFWIWLERYETSYIFRHQSWLFEYDGWYPRESRLLKKVKK